MKGKSIHSKRSMTSSEQQFKKDCSEEYLKVPPTLSPKCSDELKRDWTTLSKQLQDERAKK